MDLTTKTRDEKHLQHLRQAYGFDLEDTAGDKIVYPVGVEDYDYCGWTTFHHAAAANDTEILEDIIKQEGFDHMEMRTEPTDGHNFTPLLCAVKGDAVDTFNTLVSNGADLRAVDMNGNGIVEVAVLFRSVEIFEHLLAHRYELKDVDVWQRLLTMLFQRDTQTDKQGADAMYAALEMAEVLMKREQRYVQSFVQKGGLAGLRDLLEDCANKVRKEKKKEDEEGQIGDSKKLQQIKEEQREEHLNKVHARALKTLEGMLGHMSTEQGKVLSSHYKEIVLALVRIMNKAGPQNAKESHLAGRCLALIASQGSWGVSCLTGNNTVTNILRSVLLENDGITQFNVFKTSYKKDPDTLLKSLTSSEIEIILSILETDKRTDIKKFFIKLLTSLFESGRSKCYLYGGSIIDSLLSGLGGPDTQLTALTLDLLLLISEEQQGVEAIFRSANSFTYLVNRVVLETEDRFDKCTKLLWKLIQSFSSLQDSVKVIENIGITTVIRMIDSTDSEIVCIGCEAVRILLNSDHHDYRGQLIRREVHTKIVRLLAEVSEGHVLYCVMTSLAELALSWSSLHPIPAVQSMILQHDCLAKLVQIAQSSKLTSCSLQTAAFLLLAATLLGNPITEKRLAELDIDIEGELLKQTKHSKQSLQNAIKAIAIFRYHSFLVDNEYFNFRSRFQNESNYSLLNVILGQLSRPEKGSNLLKMLENPDMDGYICIATLSKLKRCAGDIVANGIAMLIAALYECSPRVQECAATALASLSYSQEGVDQLLIESHVDSNLLEEIARLSTHVPVSETLTSAVRGNSVRDHRRRVLSKSNTQTDIKPVKLPEIRRSRGMAMTSCEADSPTKLREASRTPVPGDKMLSKVDNVKYEDITRLGLTRPYSRTAPLPRLLVQQNTAFKPHDPQLFATVDRIYKKLYLRPATSEQSRPVTEQSGKNRQQLARSLSFVF